MTYHVRFAEAAETDLIRLFEFQLEHSHGDADLAARTIGVVRHALESLRHLPFSCRKALPENPFIRELVIPFGANGYVALFEIEDQQTVTILAVRHQREDDFY
jgi:plasmid stabilization system protein ParE